MEFELPLFQLPQRTLVDGSRSKRSFVAASSKDSVDILILFCVGDDPGGNFVSVQPGHALALSFQVNIEEGSEYAS